MTDEPKPISSQQAERMVREINDRWTALDTNPMTGGHHPVTAVTIDTGAERLQAVLKASPSTDSRTNAVEARLLSVLRTHTDLPVPELYGLVDDHDRLPAPFLLMERLPGSKHPRTELNTLTDSELQQIAKSAGEKLAELHSIEPVESFGRVVHGGEKRLCGGMPTSSMGQLELDDPVANWRPCLDQWIEQALVALEGGPFAAQLPTLHDALNRRLEAVESSYRPVLAHIDCSLDNLLVDPASGTITGMPDWEFTVAATRGYDLVYSARSLAGGPWTAIPSFPDRQTVIYEGLLEGYATVAPPGALEEFHAHRGLYELLQTAHSMIHAHDRLKLDGATPSQLEGAIEQLRDRVMELD